MMTAEVIQSRSWPARSLQDALSSKAPQNATAIILLSGAPECRSRSKKARERMCASVPSSNPHIQPLGRHKNASQRLISAAKSLASTVIDANQGAAAGLSEETIDVVTLGNLCVDIVKHVDKLPPTDKPRRRAYMDAMVAHPPPEEHWEGGGNCNTAIAAARLGLKCTALGHIGDEVFGGFLRRVLASEGVRFQEVQERSEEPLGGEDYDGETLLCWVIIHPTDGHTFCSRFDFNKGPAFSRLMELPPGFGRLMSRSKAVFCNGFVYDELPPPTVHAALRKARENGAAVFFDPGPRGEAFCRASDYKRECVETLMRLSDVVLMTAEEAETVTGIRDQEAAAEALLNRGGAIQWVVIKDGGRGCHMASHEGSFWLPAYRIDVADTVGCGDSFAAAVILGFIQGEGPITTLALANAVGAATAMGVGAGRNVAQSDVLRSILSDTARQEGAVTVRLKAGVSGNACGPSVGEIGAQGSEEQSGNGLSPESRESLLLQRAVFSERSPDELSTNGVVDFEVAKKQRENVGTSVNGCEGELGGQNKEKGRGAGLGLEGGSRNPGRISALEEIMLLQSKGELVEEHCVGEHNEFRLSFRVAAQAAMKLLGRRSKSKELTRFDDRYM